MPQAVNLNQILFHILVYTCFYRCNASYQGTSFLECALWFREVRFCGLMSVLSQICFSLCGLLPLPCKENGRQMQCASVFLRLPHYTTCVWERGGKWGWRCIYVAHFIIIYVIMNLGSHKDKNINNCWFNKGTADPFCCILGAFTVSNTSLK